MEPSFYVPDEAISLFRQAVPRGEKLEAEWKKLFDAYAAKYPDLATEWKRFRQGQLPEGWQNAIPDLGKEKPIATRAASGKVLNGLASVLPNLISGAADLAESTNTHIKDGGSFGQTPGGRNIHYGVREHCMGGVLNGMALSEMLIPVGGTFFIFTDYMRPAMRIAALMKANVIYILTHDSIGLGEDGPTHQPVEHLAAFRAMPNMTMIRPADATETAVAWEIAVSRRKGPVGLVLTRQKLPVIDRTRFAPASMVKKGGYVLADAESGKPDLILISTGSEVSICMQAWEKLTSDGIAARVVSLPCWELFDEQPIEYKQEVLPPDVSARIAVESASALGWRQYVGDRGAIIAMHSFGASAPAETSMEKFGFTSENIIAKARELLKK